MLRLLQLLLLFAVAVPVPVLGQGFESEHLPNRAAHASSAWYQELTSAQPNAYRLRTLMQRDASLQAGERSREWKQAITWLAANWHLADANGIITADTTALQRTVASKVEPTPQQVDWSCIGPFTWDRTARSATGSMGIGVVRSIDVHPDHPDTVIAGTISAGIWLSTNGGDSWRNVSDPLPVTAVWDVAIAPSDPSLVYAATNIGLVRSVDGGASFELTAWSDPNGYPESRRVDVLCVDPHNAYTLVFASEGGLHRTRDGGVTFATCPGGSGTFWDLAWHPDDRSYVYALRNDGGWTRFLRSTDGGRSFDATSQGLPSDPSSGRIPRGRLAVSRIRPAMVWVLFGGTADTVGGVWGLYRSADRGATFDHVCCGNVDGPEPANDSTNPNLFDYSTTGNGIGQLTWDMAFAVSPHDTALMAAGGIFPYTSTDGGRTWRGTQAIHYDVQDAVFTDSALWITHDGGLHRTTDLGQSMQDRSDGINSLQVWGFGRSHRTNVMAVGAYHMPTILRDDDVYAAGGFTGGWYGWSGADAMSADVNPDDDRWIYAKPWSNVRAERAPFADRIPRSTDLGIDLGYIALSNLAFHPQETYTFVGADHRSTSVVRTRNNADRWDTLYRFEDWISRVRIGPRDPRHLLAIGDARLMWSSDDGRTWDTITPPAEILRGRGMVDVVFGDVAGDVWLGLGGRQQDTKVLRTTDHGRTWANVSDGLPHHALRCLAVQEGTPGRVYAGTEDGVYTRSDAEPVWQRFGKGLPWTSLSFLHVNAVDGLLHAGTERGIWQAPLAETALPVARIARDRDTVRCSRTAVRFSDRSAMLWSVNAGRLWRFPGGEPATSTNATVSVTYAQPGRYDAELIITDGRSTDTMRLTNAVIVLPSECDGVDVMPGMAIDLRGKADHARLGRIDTTISAFTFMAWIKPRGEQPDFSAVFCTDGPGNPQEVGMQFFAPDNQLGYLWSGGRWWWKSGLRAEPDQWSHVAMIITPTHATVMVNGEARTDSIALSAIDLRGLDMVLGTYHFWDSRNARMEIDEVRCFDRALSVDDVRRMMHHPIATNEPGLLCWYQANESGGEVLYDKHQGAPGRLESGAQRTTSTIPFGAGSTQVQHGPGSGWALFEDVGTDLLLRSATDADVLCTRILRSPDSLQTTRPSLPVTWIIRAIADTTANMSSVRVGISDLLTPADAAARRFTMHTRDVNDHRATWTIDRSLASLPPSYDPQSNTLRGWFTQNLPLQLQLAFTMEGGLVGVEEREGERIRRVWPLPAASQLHVNALAPITELRLVDLQGRTVVELAAEHDTSATLDVRSLPMGTYVLVVNSERRLVHVVR